MHFLVQHGGVFAQLCDLVALGDVAILTGAGMSTDSGIPDYRGPNGALRRHTPMTYQQFTRDPAARRRYWARSHVGWQGVARARPNAGHRALVDLEEAGFLAGIITQNVDGLHRAAGSRRVVELHGNLSRVLCRGCGQVTSRSDLDRRLREANPGFEERLAIEPWSAEVNPDGDVTLSDEVIADFVMVNCTRCGGDLEPDVVFFGATVPPRRLAAAVSLLESARSLLVLGSSLQVMSGYRFVLRACERGIPVGIVNQGPTRGDRYAWFKLDAPLGEVLPQLASVLTGWSPTTGAYAIPGVGPTGLAAEQIWPAEQTWSTGWAEPATGTAGPTATGPAGWAESPGQVWGPATGPAGPPGPDGPDGPIAGMGGAAGAAPPAPGFAAGQGPDSVARSA